MTDETNQENHTSINSLAKRLAFKVGIGFELTLRDGLKAWLFTCRAECIRGYRLKKCFWPHVWLRIIGFWVGIGFMYVSTESIDKEKLCT